jgi:hypothetical protein
MNRLEEYDIKLREQAYNRLTLAAGNLMLMGAGIYTAIEGRPVSGSVVALGGGTVGALFSRLGIIELKDSKQE